MLRFLSSVMAPPKYTNPIVRLCSWRAALIVNDTFPTPLVSRHIISVFASDIVSSNDEHAVSITVVILSSPSDNRDTIPVLSAYSIPHNLCTSSPSIPLRPSTLPVREVLFFSPSAFRWGCTMLSVMVASARKRLSATRSMLCYCLVKTHEKKTIASLVIMVCVRVVGLRVPSSCCGSPWPLVALVHSARSFADALVDIQFQSVLFILCLNKQNARRTHG